VLTRIFIFHKNTKYRAQYMTDLHLFMVFLLIKIYIGNSTFCKLNGRPSLF
jgi:hypothetical protein